VWQLCSGCALKNLGKKLSKKKKAYITNDAGLTDYKD